MTRSPTDPPRRVRLDGPLDLAWVHLASGRRPALAGGVRILPPMEINGINGDIPRFLAIGDRPRATLPAIFLRKPVPFC